MSRYRVGDRSGNGSQCSMMQNIVDLSACAFASKRITYIAFDELKFLPLRNRNQLLHFIEISTIPGGKIVQADDQLIKAKQGFDEVRPDEPRTAGHQPTTRLRSQILGNPLNGRSQRRHTVTPCATSSASLKMLLTSVKTPLF